jgi:hypothetical protein
LTRPRVKNHPQDAAIFSLRKVPFPRIPIAVDEKDVGRFFVANVLNDIFEDSFDVRDDDGLSHMRTVLERMEAKRKLDAVPAPQPKRLRPGKSKQTQQRSKDIFSTTWGGYLRPRAFVLLVTVAFCGMLMIDTHAQACKHAHTPAKAHDRHASASVCICTSCASKISAKQRSRGSQHDVPRPAAKKARPAVDGS